MNVKSIKIALGAIDFTGILVIPAIVIYGIEAGELQKRESGDKDIKEVIQVANWNTLGVFQVVFLIFV